MSKHLNLDERLRVPYSIGTGIPKGGDAEIEGYVQSLRTQGFCVIDRVISKDQVDAVRESVHRGRELLQQDREAERRKRIEIERQRDPDAEIDDSPERFERWREDPVRPPMAPHAELCEYSRGARPSPKYLAEPRVTAGLPEPCSIRTSVFCRRRSTSRRDRRRNRYPSSSLSTEVGILTGPTI